MIYISELKKYVPPGTYFFGDIYQKSPKNITKKYHQKRSPKKYESNISVKIWPWNLGVTTVSAAKHLQFKQTLHNIPYVCY